MKVSALPNCAEAPGEPGLRLVTELLSTPAADGRAAFPAGLPEGLNLAEHASGVLRRYLQDRGLAHYELFCGGAGGDLELHDLDEYLGDLGEGDARWEPAPPLVAGGAQPSRLVRHRRGAGPGVERPGILRLAGAEVVVARWYWYDPSCSWWECFWLCAAPSPAAYYGLRDRLRTLRRGLGAGVWQVVRGVPACDGERLRHEPGAGWDDLILSPRLRQRLGSEVAGFFDEPAAALYRRLNVPYRRGVLLYGPPGNGKTSIIRALAAHVPSVPALVLRAEDRCFDDSDFRHVVRRWADHAPAVLVIEDLNWLMPDRIGVGTFLNLIDGLDTPRDGAGGLMLIASTNYPENLDRAISNRPGRFDVTLEVPNPDAALRREFFTRHGPPMDEEPVTKVVRRTAGLSFAHLREVMHLAGLLAIGAGREERGADDVLEAARRVSRANREATNGFPKAEEVPFGLAQFSARSRDDG